MVISQVDLAGSDAYAPIANEGATPLHPNMHSHTMP